MANSSHIWANAWEVLVLFLIPIGGGIPAGVLLAKTRGFQWPTTTFLYFVSDVILALLFEPMIWLMALAGKHYRVFARLNEAFKKSTAKSIAKYGVKPKPFSLIMFSFVIDPMTGRTAAFAAGHGFVSGWTLAILGDMIFYMLLMVSTLFLNNVLGDGTWTAIIIVVVMMIVPALVRRIRDWSSKPKQEIAT